MASTPIQRDKLKPVSPEIVIETIDTSWRDDGEIFC